MVKPTDLEDPTATLVQYIKDNWNAANTPNVGTPSFSTDWITKTSKPTPLVTVTNREDTKTAAGPGYSSIRGDGSGANQRKTGFVLVNVWAESDHDPDTDTSPKVLREEMWNEIERIILDAFTGTGDLESLALAGPGQESGEWGGVAFVRAFGRLEYQYTLTPV